MRMNDLAPNPGSVHKKKRVGRGNSSGHGTSAGRGTKGQQSRSGYSRRIGFEGGQNPLIRSLSRLRGFTNRFRVQYEPVNVSDLAKLPAGTSVTPASLREAGIVKSARLPVKILGGGEISVKLTVEAERFSATARAKIEAAGGTVVELNPAPVKEAKEAPVRAAKQEEKEEESPKAAPEEATADSAEAEEESEA
jgi:large subunit ribosomal protein L15